MTLYVLDVAPDDVSAAALGYRFDTDPAPEALVTTLLDHPDHPASLRLSILGASHAVTLVVDGHDTVTEEVSCRASTSGGGLPGANEPRTGPWGTHRLEGTVETVTPVGLATLVEQLSRRAELAPEVLAGRFPGAEGALTVVAASAVSTGWEWRTWHLYPSLDSGVPEIGGEVVTTVSSLEVSLVGPLTEVGV